MILVVDDKVTLQPTLQGALTRAGYAVATARNNMEALDYLRRHEPPELILLDVGMPTADDLSFLTLQQNDPLLAHIPVVVLSECRLRAWDAGTLPAAELLLKPVAFETLVASITEHCVPAEDWLAA